MSKERFSIIKRLESFKFALEGFKTLMSEEHNARIHLVGALVAIALGFWLDVAAFEWCFIALAVAMVFMTELINSSLENLCDYACKENHPSIKKVKDMAAAAVLISALFAVLVALLIFLPKIIVLCTST